MKNKVRKEVLVLYDPPPPFGGVRILAHRMFEVLAQSKELDYRHHAFDSASLSPISSLAQFARAAARADAVLFQTGDLLSLGRAKTICFVIIASLLRKPIFHKGTAGGLTRQFKSLAQAKKHSIAAMLRRFRFFTIETSEDLPFFQQLAEIQSNQARHLPGGRIPLSARLERRMGARRFCFFGKVGRQKGVHHILDIANNLPREISIDIYGPMEARDRERIGLNNNTMDSPVQYRGTVHPDKVSDVMRAYDGLLLPTTWKTEGHPGVIFEALSSGVPVIATRWNGIPEVVDDSCGILIDPDSPSQLLSAIETLSKDSELWNKMREGALKRAKAFDLRALGHTLHSWILKELE